MKTIIYITEDGKKFKDLNDAVNHDNVIQFHKYHEFGHYGYIRKEAA